MAWRRAGSTDAYQELTFAEDNLENFYTVPTAVLQASSQVEILVRYTDGTSATATAASYFAAIAARRGRTRRAMSWLCAFRSSFGSRFTWRSATSEPRRMK